MNDEVEEGVVDDGVLSVLIEAPIFVLMRIVADLDEEWYIVTECNCVWPLYANFTPYYEHF